MNAAKTSTPRVAAMRSARIGAGLTRWELSPPPHPDDRPEIKELADKLARKPALLNSAPSSNKQSANQALCYCDQIGCGEPGVSCGDCPTRDYPHIIAKTNAERVDKLRKKRVALGLVRLDLYAHPEDCPAIKTLAEKLQRRRAKLAAPRAG